jgi:dihydroflavonol-4-reductase
VCLRDQIDSSSGESLDTSDGDQHARGVLVSVTGGTGYVGSHAIAALIAAGHRVRVLARAPERVQAALGSLGVDGVEVARGDVTDSGAVEQALTGCDAVLHAASVFSLNPRRAEEMRAVNVRGTELVLGTAHRLGLDPIVHVSSELALLPPSGGEPLRPDSPVGESRWPYCRSKAESETVARAYQTKGAPVVSVMPSAVWGPFDPHFGEGATLCANVLKKRYPIVSGGGMHISDVRDLASVLVAAIEPGRGPRSYLVAGEYVSLPDIIRTLAELSGRRLPFLTAPSWFLAVFGRGADVVQRGLKGQLPWSGEGIWVVNCSARCDSTRARAELGFQPRPLRETFTDTVRWLVDAGALTSREAGLIAGTE